MPDNVSPAEPSTDSLLKATPQRVREAARAMLEDPNLMDRILDDVHANDVAGETVLIKTVYVVATSRKLPKPCSAIVQSATATGKTITVSATTSCIPPEDVIRATSITTNGLYYGGREGLKHKLIVAGERKKQQSGAQADATAALRQLLSDGQISKLVTDTSVSPPTTRHIVIDGPVAYIETTTSIDIFDEDLNRCLPLSADERPEQTRRVLKHIAMTHSGAPVPDCDAIIERHHAMQRMLQQRPVIVPFAGALAERFPVERPEARRAFGQLLGMVEACALLHQYQRELDSDQRIIATLADYGIAAELCRSPLARLLGGKITDASIRFHKRLQEWADDTFTTTEAVNADDKSRQAVYTWLDELASIGAVAQIEPRKGSRPAVWRFTDMAHEDVAQGGFDLPTVAQLQDDLEWESELEAAPEADEIAATRAITRDSQSTEYGDDWPPF